MKIKRVEASRIALPLREMLYSKNASGVLTLDQSMVIYVKIFTDEGVTGSGTAATVPGYSGMIDEQIISAIKFLTPHVVGLDPFNIEEIHQTMNHKLVGNTPAKAGIDLALYDIMGKATGRPVHQLIGGKMREDFVTDRALITERRTVKEIAKFARAYVEEGYRGFEIHVGSDLERNLAVVSGIRDSFKDVVIIADAHSNWSPKEAIRNIKALERYDIYVEQPTNGIENMAEVKRAVDVIITADEECFTIDDAMRIIISRAADCLTVKIPKAGGIYPARKIITLAESAGLLVRIDGVPGDTKLSNTAGAHLALTARRLMPGSGVMQHRAWLKDDFSVSGGLIFKDGKVSVPDTPGIGVVPNEKLVRLYTSRA